MDVTGAYPRSVDCGHSRRNTEYPVLFLFLFLAVTLKFESALCDLFTHIRQGCFTDVVLEVWVGVG